MYSRYDRACVCQACIPNVRPNGRRLAQAIEARPSIEAKHSLSDSLIEESRLNELTMKKKSINL